MAWNGSDQTTSGAPRSRGRISPKCATPVDATSPSRRKKTNPTAVPLLSRPAFYLLSLLLLALAGAAVWYFLRPAPPPPPKAQGTRHNAQIAPHTPAPARTNKVEKAEKPKPKKPVDPYEDYDHDKCFRDEKGILRYKHDPSLWAYDKAAKRAKPIVLGQANRPSPFKHDSEREIAALLTMRPGERRYGQIDYNDPDFQNDFLEAMVDKIEIKDDDRADDKELKQAVIEVKKELADRIRAGESLAEILGETRREYEKLAEYKVQIQEQVAKIVKDGNGEFSKADVIDCVTAANTMLEEKGINPIKATEMVLWNVRLHAEKSGASPEAVAAEVDAAADAMEKAEAEKAEAKKTAE